MRVLVFLPLYSSVCLLSVHRPPSASELFKPSEPGSCTVKVMSELSTGIWPSLVFRHKVSSRLLLSKTYLVASPRCLDRLAGVFQPFRRNLDFVCNFTTKNWFFYRHNWMVCMSFYRIMQCHRYTQDHGSFLMRFKFLWTWTVIGASLVKSSNFHFAGTKGEFSYGFTLQCTDRCYAKWNFFWSRIFEAK